MDPALYERLESTLRTSGAKAAIDQLCADLRERQDYRNLFYALLLKKRQELGVSVLPTGPAQDIPAEVHGAYEEGIREAGRLVGRFFLERGEIAPAWNYFRMLGEPDPVREALQAHQPGEDEDVSELVQIAFYEGVHPTRGFDWVLSHFGLCSAITTLGGQELPFGDDVRQHCISAVVRALYAELRERLTAEIEHHDGAPPPEAAAPEGSVGVIRGLLAGRDWLFADEDCYHIDISHLSSVVQMSLRLRPGEAMEMARELCAYGERLPGRFQGQSDPPFEDFYKAHGMYLAILSGDRVEEGLDYFRKEAEKADPEEVGTLPAEVLVTLLVQLGRKEEALAVAREYLSKEESRPLVCPAIPELCREAGDFRALAEVARERDDPVNFLAGLLEAERTGRG
jgi:hypothetical protein